MGPYGTQRDPKVRFRHLSGTQKGGPALWATIFITFLSVTLQPFPHSRLHGVRILGRQQTAVNGSKKKTKQQA